MGFKHNQSVEVCKKQEGTTYHTAKILAAIAKTQYLVRYENLFSEDRTRLLTETVDESDIRPCPPLIPYTGFQISDRVDAFVDEAWTLGTIVRKVSFYYYVKLDSNGDEVHFSYNQLRLHLEFRDPNWVYYREGVAKNTVVWRQGLWLFVEGCPNTNFDNEICIQMYKGQKRICNRFMQHDELMSGNEVVIGDTFSAPKDEDDEEEASTSEATNR